MWAESLLGVVDVPVDFYGEGVDVGEELGDSRDGSGEFGERLSVALREAAFMEEDGQASKQATVQRQRDSLLADKQRSGG